MRDAILLSAAALAYFGLFAALLWTAKSAKERGVILAFGVGIIVVSVGLAHFFPGQQVHFHTPGGFINRCR